LNRDQLRRRISAYTYRLLVWGQDHVPVGVRSLVGLLFLVGGVFFFLPILGLWMFPHGRPFIAHDLPINPPRNHDRMQRRNATRQVERWELAW
jgi:hypothetical protein